MYGEDQRAPMNRRSTAPAGMTSAAATAATSFNGGLPRFNFDLKSPPVSNTNPTHQEQHTYNPPSVETFVAKKKCDMPTPDMPSTIPPQANFTVDLSSNKKIPNSKGRKGKGKKSHLRSGLNGLNIPRTNTDDTQPTVSVSDSSPSNASTGSHMSWDAINSPQPTSNQPSFTLGVGGTAGSSTNNKGRAKGRSNNGGARITRRGASVQQNASAASVGPGVDAYTSAVSEATRQLKLQREEAARKSRAERHDLERVREAKLQPRKISPVNLRLLSRH